jgi:hypothetical protein
MRPRQSNVPKRRIAEFGKVDPALREKLVDKLAYVGSALHKSKPGDYGFHPPVNPRPWKSICDGGRVILSEEARSLFRQGIMLGMFSECPPNSIPKYVWAVDAHGEAYEAKISPGGFRYKGYRLEEEDAMRAIVLQEWSRRCSAS